MNALLLAAAIATGGIHPIDVQSHELARPEGPRQYLIADPAPTKQNTGYRPPGFLCPSDETPLWVATPFSRSGSGPASSAPP